MPNKRKLKALTAALNKWHHRRVHFKFRSATAKTLHAQMNFGRKAADAETMFLRTLVALESALEI